MPGIPIFSLDLHDLPDLRYDCPGRNQEVATMRARESESKGADPVRVFMILTAILVAIGVVFWLTRSDPLSDTQANATSPNESPDFSLTNEEAIARFKELDEIRLQALRDRDASLLPLAFTRDGQAITRLQKSISQLRDDQVLFRSKYKTESIQVIMNSSGTIEVAQVVVVTPHFKSEKGEDVTGKRFSERQVSEWVLQRRGDQWLIEDRKSVV